MKTHFTVLLMTILFATSASAQFFESVQGDASNDASNPTLIDLNVGSNLVGGSVTLSNDIVDGDIDFYTFVIEEGELLTGIFLPTYTPNDAGFHGITVGSTGIAPSGPNAGDVSQFLGSQHLGLTSNNLLDGFSNSVAGAGFEGPLGPGTYSYIIQQTGNVVVDYTLDFQVVPEPAAASIANFFALVALALVRRRRRNR